MQVEILDAGPNRKLLKVTVPIERIKTHLEKVCAAANRQVKMKGFRPGKVPRRLLMQQLGDSILAEAKESVINETFREAMSANQLDVIGTPKLDVGPEPLAEDQELHYTVEFDLRPQVKIGTIRDIEVPRRPTEPTEEEVDNALQQLAQAKRKLQAVTGELKDGDFAKVDMAYRLEGEEIVRKEGLQISAVIPVRGCDPEEFRAKLVGQTANQTVTLPIKYPDTFEKDEARGKDGEVVISIREVMRFVAPNVDDDLAKVYEQESLDKLRQDIHDRIAAEKHRVEEDRVFNEILDHLYAENPFDLPEGLVADEIKHRVEHFQEDLVRQGAPKEDAERRATEVRGEIEQASRTGIRNLFLVEGISKKEKLFVTEGDVDTELKRIAAENDTSLAEVRKYLEEKRMLPELRLDLMHRKVRDFLKQTVKMTDSREAEGS